MGRLLGGNAPLRGRASMEMVIRPFGYREAARFWDISDPRLALLVHSVVGGTPAYRREFVTGDSPASMADFDPWLRNSQATFLSHVVGPHFEVICREWAASVSGDDKPAGDVIGEAAGEVAAGVVADPLRRSQIQVDVAVFAPEDPGRPRRILSLGEAKWEKVMNLGHLERLRRARDLLAAKGYDTSATKLTCYSGAGFDPAFGGIAVADPLVQLVGLDTLYGLPSG